MILVVLAILLTGVPIAFGESKTSRSPIENFTNDVLQRLSSIQAKTKLFRSKRIEKLRQVKSISQVIEDNQRKLESAKISLVQHQSLLVQTRSQLVVLESNLDQLVGETARLSKDAAQRLRNIYMGERLSLLQMVLDANDLSTLLDRMYYKQKLVAQDTQLLQNLEDKTRLYREQKARIQQQKEYIGNTIVKIQSFQTQVSSRIGQDQVLREKYQNDAKFYEQAEQQLLTESANIRNYILSQRRKGGATSSPVVGSTGTFGWPIFGSVSSGFGFRFHPIHRKWMMHTGLDITAPMGSPVRASDGGEILQAAWRGGYGKVIIIDHGNRKGVDLVTLYGHLSGWAVSKGATVHKGQVIGYVGSTGFATGPHLHFEVRVNGSPVNPSPYLSH